MLEPVIPFSPKNGNPGCMVGVESCLDEERILKGLKLFITDYGKPNAPFSINLYEFSLSKRPNIEIPITEKSFNSIITSGNDWTSIDLKNESIKLFPGKYLISVRWLEAPGNDGLESLTIGFKKGYYQEPISWMNWSGKESEWSKDTGPYTGNFMIQPIFT